MYSEYVMVMAIAQLICMVFFVVYGLYGIIFAIVKREQFQFNSTPLWVSGMGMLALGFMLSNVGFIRARGQGQFTQCQSNCKNIGTALEMYSTDNRGHYPPSMSKVAGDYLRVIPTCASAGEDTYSSSYTVYNVPPKPPKKTEAGTRDEEDTPQPTEDKTQPEESMNKNCPPDPSVGVYVGKDGEIVPPDSQHTPSGEEKKQDENKTGKSDGVDGAYIGTNGEKDVQQCEDNPPTHSDEGVYNDSYTFFCRGENHIKVAVPANYPQYNSTQGLVSRPGGY